MVNNSTQQNQFTSHVNSRNTKKDHYIQHGNPSTVICEIVVFCNIWYNKKHSLLLISVMRKYISMLLDKANNLQNKYFTNSCIPE
jgi:hypothetical protein